jgi:hypothetical protein
MSALTTDESLVQLRIAAAGLAMAGLIKQKGIKARPDEVAKEAIEIADALLVALKPAASP